MKWRWLLTVAVVGLGACGGGSSTSSGSGGSPTTPTTTLTPTGLPTITITASGVGPKQLEIPVGSRVLFVNNDNVPHEIASNPHPTHEECPPINEVSALAPGQSRQTGVFTTARTCGYHDHGQSENISLQGTIVIR